MLNFKLKLNLVEKAKSRIIKFQKCRFSIFEDYCINLNKIEMESSRNKKIEILSQYFRNNMHDIKVKIISINKKAYRTNSKTSNSLFEYATSSYG